MAGLFGEGSLFSSLGSVSGAVNAAIIAIVLLSIAIILNITNLNIFGLFKKVFDIIIKVFGKIINKSEKRYHRDLAIGKIDEKRRTVKTYRFLNDLIIDLGLKEKGATPYEFLYICLVGSFIGTIMLCQLLFGNLWMLIPMYPIVFAAIICVLYTKANISHDTRIEAVIEAENIICNNIQGGVVVAVRTSLDVLPVEVRGSFRNFLDNVEHKNYHIKTALMELNHQLGSIADDFIKKCIVLETEEEHGIVGMFKDVVEMNNIKMELRTEMKRKFEEVTVDFVIGASMIFLFLAGVLAIYPDVRRFYLNTPIGQLIIAFDILILISEFVYITYLRAQEL